ncbi:unnamed protein product [Ceutorhynchus assimilis]|uniref:GB1/RHD3-type G domain-containing protein n=1 Tax=Ceutorhynchus assimilis TaxID=467358 RepID=A0A9P0GRR6_9CUCU|nr:unnamed protein product [Ceutorhynchus assimilis]
MSKSHDFYPGTTERICLISGNVDAIMVVLDFIMDKIREKPDMTKPIIEAGDSKLTQERDKQVKILVPNSTAGMIIGKAGNYIKLIKENSGSYVQISQKAKDVSLQERCITVIGKVVEDPQSGTCLNVSYADVSGPVANYNPTGSPFAQQPGAAPFGPTTATISQQGLVLNGAGAASLSLNLTAPGQSIGGFTAQLLDHIKIQLRSSGLTEAHIAEISAALTVLAKYGILGVGLGIQGAHHAGAMPVSSYLSVMEQAGAAGTFGAVGQISLGECLGANSPTPRSSLERYESAFDPFRHQVSTSAATAPISLNNNSFGLGTNHHQWLHLCANLQLNKTAVLDNVRLRCCALKLSKVQHIILTDKKKKKNYFPLNMSELRQRKTLHIEAQQQDSDPIEEGPHAVPIIVAGPDHSFQLDEDALKKVLLRDEIKDRYVVVISVAGAFRHGKSFLLDFFLRYMNSKYVHKQNSSEWMGSDQAPLDGFSWRGGSERDTTGILMWSEVFLTELATGEKVAILLLDTQGTWDSKSTVKECATIFALSTMISSVQIYNLSTNIQEDDLQHLQLFTEYGRLALADSGKTPFQRLQFLVRDWRFPYEANYGAVGGSQILEKRLEVNDHQHSELQSLRKHIRSCFSEIACFLMPHPGIRVATSPTFDGRLAEIDQEFKDNLKVLVPMILSPENLVLKKINGEKVKVRDFVQYCKSYMQIYEGNELPEPKSMLVATAEANNLAAVADAKDVYVQLMEDVCGGAKPYLKTETMEVEHKRVKDKAIEQFEKKKKMGGDEFSAVYKEQLEKDIEDTFFQFKSHNESKNIFKSARTPAVFFALAIAFYITSGLFGLFGLYSLANTCNLGMALAFLTLVTWAYIRYSGEMRELGLAIDESANFIWENVSKCLEKKQKIKTNK